MLILEFQVRYVRKLIKVSGTCWPDKGFNLEYTGYMKSFVVLLQTLLFTGLFSSEVVYARMYQWTEPDTGSTQLSGKPPAWYRSSSSGPRVFVFENGRLIDDTAAEVSDKVRERMREQAFVLAEEDDQKAKDKVTKSRELKQKFTKDGLSEIEETKQEDIAQDLPDVELLSNEPIYQDGLDEDLSNDGDKEKKLDELRKVIADWEKTQTENAKKALE